MGPKICFGMTLHNNGKYLQEAIESILGQSYGDFYLVAVDDCSTDETEEKMRYYQKKDNRISYFRNDTWHGLIKTWRKAFQKAFDLYHPSYFAWASDHDVWNKDWLEQHVKVLNKYTNAVLAYSETVAISAAGALIEMPFSAPFETIKMSKVDRMYRLCRILRGSGDKVYGLFRTEALIKAGIFRFLPMPDRLLLVEIGTLGPFKYIPEKLWKRRYLNPIVNGDAFIEKQNKYLFGMDTIPFYSQFPYISHSLSLALSLGFFSGNPEVDLKSGLLMSTMYWEANFEKTITNELERYSRIFNSKAPKNEIKEYGSIVKILNLIYGNETEERSDLIGTIVSELLKHYSELKTPIRTKNYEDLN